MPLIMEGTRPLSGPALPNLINAVSMFKVNFNVNINAVSALALAFAEINKFAEIKKLTLTLTF